MGGCINALPCESGELIAQRCDAMNQDSAGLDNDRVKVTPALIALAAVAERVQEAVPEPAVPGRAVRRAARLTLAVATLAVTPVLPSVG